MKRLIAIMLAVVLVAGGLGGFAYAQATNPGHLVAFDQPFRCADIEPDVDSVAADTELSGHYSWNFHIHNNSEQMVVDPTISVESSSYPGFPDGTFPAEWYKESLEPWEKWWIHALSSTEPITFTLGYDSSRTMEPLAIPPGGGVQQVTIKVKPLDERYTSDPYMRIEVWGDVVDHTEPVGAVPTINPEGKAGIVWAFRDWGLGEEYTFTAELQVENPMDVDLLHKPFVHMYVQSTEVLSEGTGTTITIYDEILSGEITYSVSTAGDWHRIIADCWLVEYKPLSQPLLEYEPMTGQKLVGMGYLGEHYDEESDVTFQLHTMFSFTNPDGVSEITINRVSILDRYGTVLYEGPLKPWPEERIMMPHEVDAVELHDYLEPGDLIPVTVEIFWSGSHKEGLPLIGWQLTSIGIHDAEGNLIEMTSSESQMVNMVQVLTPEKEKEVTTLRLQTWYQPDDPFMQPLENFAKAVKKNSGGSVLIEVYPSDALVPNRELAEAVKQGTVEMGLIFSSQLRGYSRVIDAGWLPFLYNDDDGLMAAVQAGIGDLLSDELTGHNITALTWTTTAFSHLYSRDKMLDDPGDLTLDVKIRVIGGMGGAHEGMQWEAITEWGGTPVTLAFAEIYELLRDGKIHGAMHSPYLYEVMKFYEVAPYFCVDYAFANLSGLCINSDVWNSLDANTRDIITQAAGDYVDEMLATVKLVDAEALQQIQQHPEFPVEVYTLSPEERAIWREVSQPVWEWWLEELGDARPVGEEIIAIALPLNPLPEP